MSNINNNSLKNCKPSLRIGLSRKRKSFGDCDNFLKKSMLGKSCEREIMKEDIEIINKMKILEGKQICETSEKSVNDSMEEENIFKCSQVMECKIVEIESLYSTWRNGCKNAFFYLLDLIKNTHSQGVDIEKLMRELGILNVMSTHFKDDLDLPFSSLYHSD